MPRLVGIFGGTFDPVHYGHSNTISELLNLIPFEKILVIPNSLPPHRENSQASFSHRYKMISLAFRDIEKTVDAAQRVEGNEDSLDLPPFLRRNLGGFSVTNSINQNGHSSGQ